MLIEKNRKRREVEEHLLSFVKKAITHMQPEFEKRQVIVEIDISEKRVHCIG